MNHRIARLIFGFGVGFVVAFIAFKWITDPAPRVERQLEESAVMVARTTLQNALGLPTIEIVDPLAPNRKIGKSYVYRAADGWEISGYYRRNEDDRWHPYLMGLDDSLAIIRLKIRDAEFVERAAADPMLEVIP
jgi:hypothetical protein